MASSSYFFDHIIDDSLLKGISPLTTVKIKNDTVRQLNQVMLSFSVYTSIGIIPIQSRMFTLNPQDAVQKADENDAYNSWVSSFNAAYSYVNSLVNPSGGGA